MKVGGSINLSSSIILEALKKNINALTVPCNSIKLGNSIVILSEFITIGKERDEQHHIIN